MANAIYPKYKEALLNGGANTDMSAGTVKVALVDTGVYTYNAAHDFKNPNSERVKMASDDADEKALLKFGDPTKPGMVHAKEKKKLSYVQTYDPVKEQKAHDEGYKQQSLEVFAHRGPMTTETQVSLWKPLSRDELLVGATSPKQ